MLSFCKVHNGILTVTLHTQPKARKTEIVGLYGASLKVKLAAQPIDGAANKELLKFFAEFLGITPSRITLEHGAQSKHKIIKITGISAQQFEQALIKARIKIEN